jgi:predicted transposase YdaD
MPLVSNFEKLAKEEGKQETIGVLIRQLKRKIGNFSPELEFKIRSLSLEKLEDLGESLLDFISLNDLISWLENH